MKDLKENYETIENTVIENTKKTQKDEIERHREVLTHIENLRQFLKSEVANRKETEFHFERKIEKRSNEIAEQFNITYLNNLYQMRDKLKSFEERKEKMDLQSKELR